MSEIVNKVAQAMKKSGQPEEEVFKALAQAAVSAIQTDAKTERRRRKKTNDEQTDQLNIRANLSDINRFVEWCEKNRYTQREGFSQLAKLIDLLD